MIAPRVALFLMAALAAGARADVPLELAQGVDGARLLATIRELPVQRSANGDGPHARGLRETESLLISRLQELGYEVRTQELRWAPPRQPKENETKEGEGAEPPKPWRNLWVDIKGSTKPEEVLLLGAHFDAVPGSPGADDNASGTAALLELARLYAPRREAPPARTIRLAFFNLEEVGLIGSSRYYHAWKNEQRQLAEVGEKGKTGETPVPPERTKTSETIRAMISLEMLAYFCDEPGCQRSPIPKSDIKGPKGPVAFEPPTVGDNIVLVGIARHQLFTDALAAAMRRAAPELKVFEFDVLPIAAPDILRSDHAPFLLGGVPAGMLTDTANFRNPHYHKPSDTIETLDAARYTLVVRAIAGAWWQLADEGWEKPDAATPKP